MQDTALRASWTTWSIIWKTVLLVWIPQYLIWYIVLQIFPGPKQEFVFSSQAGALFFTCLFAPYIETQGMRFLFFLLGRWTESQQRLKWYVAAIFGALHADSESWGLHAIWGFYVMSNCYLEQNRISTRRAVWMTVAVHSLCNLVSYAATLLESTLGWPSGS